MVVLAPVLAGPGTAVIGVSVVLAAVKLTVPPEQTADGFATVDEIKGNEFVVTTTVAWF